MTPDGTFIVLIFAAAAAMWFPFILPTIVAFRRQHPNRWLIAAINVFLGASGIGWAIALIWALQAAHRTTASGGTNGGESGLNIFANDAKPVALIGVRTATEVRPGQVSALAAVAELERLQRLLRLGAVSDDEFATLKAGILRRA